MDKYLVIKLSKKKVITTDNRTRTIIVTYNTSRVNGGFRFDKIGVIKYYKNICFCYVDLYKLGYWLNRGAYLKSKTSWLVGLIGKNEFKLK